MLYTVQDCKYIYSAVAKNICDFVSSRFNKNYKFTIDLYKTLIELMSNTVHHAYDEKGLMAPCWYLYAINKHIMLVSRVLYYTALFPFLILLKMLNK